MIHAFRLGPVSSSGGAEAYVYVGLTEGGEPFLHEAPSDRGGLEVLQGQAPGQPLSCEPALAEAGKGLGLESAPLPPGVLKARAVLAYELATGVQHGASKPDALAAFLRGAAAFWAARSWEVVGSEERLHVAFLEGHAEVDAELSVVGGDGTRLPGVALCDARSAVAELAKLEGEARAEAALRLASLTVEMERDPAWATEAIEEGYGLPRLPVAVRRRGAGVAPMVTQDLLVAGALLEAIAAWTGLDEDGAVGEGTAEAAGMRVVARVRVSEQAPGAPSEGLTPARDEPAPDPAEAKAAAEATAAAEAKAAAEAAAAAEAKAAEEARAAAEAKAAAEAAAEAEAKAAAEASAAEEAKGAARALTPVGPPPEPSATAATTPAPEPPPEASEGWLTRAWRSLRGEGAPKPPRPAAAPARRPAPAALPAAARPAAASRPPPPPGPAVDDSDPFAPIARALRIALPVEPPPPSAADEETIAEVAGRVLEAARAAAGELVSFPAVALEIVERVHDPKADARGVAGFIARDPALAADVVSIANSAAFRGASEIESVHEAVARLGLAEVGRVASAVAARKLLDPKGRGGAQAGPGLFVRAVAVATAASGEALRQRGARSDHVWLGGLLHDVGKALARQLLARLASEPGAHLTPVDIGERVVERIHVEVGEAAIRQWALPAYLLEICAHHHDETVPAGAMDLHLVRLTSALACLDEPAVAARAAREILQSAGALKLGAPAVRALATDLKAAEERARSMVR